MPFVSSAAASNRAGATRPIVAGLFVSSVLLSVVSWYTTEQGMALYLSGWFALLASLGVQTALVLVAWLIGFTKTKRALLIAVYVITAAVSIGFSYVSLFTWFSARERPLEIERRLYDRLNADAEAVQETVTAATSEAQKHALALRELTEAEKTHGHISRAQDADPYLARVREAVAREAQTYDSKYREGSGEGVRYSAFDRYTRMAEQSLGRLQSAGAALANFRANLKPLDATEKQLRGYQQAYGAVPWKDVEEALDGAKFERPAAAGYSEFVDKSASGQEDLMVAFRELFTAPGPRHVFAFTLAAFIDVIVFLVAFASGPYFFGGDGQRWVAASAALESLDDQVFVRDFLRKLTPTVRGMARVEASALTPGEQQLCLLLVAKRMAATVEEEGRLVYLLDQSAHEQLLESLAAQGFPLRASARPA